MFAKRNSLLLPDKVIVPTTAGTRANGMQEKVSGSVQICDGRRDVPTIRIVPVAPGSKLKPKSEARRTLLTVELAKPALAGRAPPVGTQVVPPPPRSAAADALPCAE
jgi:hypothetical protein